MIMKVIKYQPVEIIIPSGFAGSSIAVQNQSSLYNKLIVGLEVYPATYCKYSPITNTPTVADADLTLLNLQFYNGSDQIAKNLPIQKLNRFAVAAGAFINDYFEVADWMISWDKCILDVTKASDLSVNTGVCVTIGVYYKDMPTGYVRPIN